MTGRYAVVGVTSWGVTLAWLLSARGHRVVLVGRGAGEVEEARVRHGVERLPEIRLDDGAVSYATGRDLPRGLDGVVVAVPAQSLRSTVASGEFPRDISVLSAAKGIELTTGLRMSEVLVDRGWALRRVSVLSGPNLAPEIARGMPAASVVASTTEAEAAGWQEALSGAAFRVYRSTDLVGVELAGALKNVIAIAAGAAAGLGLGANSIAAIVTRGLAEMARLGMELGGRAETFQGLAGVGDLTVTCFSALSRNRTMGELLAAGLTPGQAEVRAGGVVEGARTAPVALRIAQREGVEMPITEQVVAVLEGRLTVPEAMSRLLSRGVRDEA